MLPWHLWRQDWWSTAHTCSHFLLAPSSGLLAPLFHAWHIPNVDMKDVATGLEGKKEALTPLPSIICFQQETLFQNSWWESGQESSYSFPIPKSPGPLGKVCKVLPFPSTCCEICVYTTTATTSPELCTNCVPQKCPFWSSTVQINRMEGRAEELCFSCGHPLFFLQFSLQQQRYKEL